MKWIRRIIFRLSRREKKRNETLPRTLDIDRRFRTIKELSFKGRERGREREREREKRQMQRFSSQWKTALSVVRCKLWCIVDNEAKQSLNSKGEIGVSSIFLLNTETQLCSLKHLKHPCRDQQSSKVFSSCPCSWKTYQLSLIHVCFVFNLPIFLNEYPTCTIY